MSHIAPNEIKRATKGSAINHRFAVSPGREQRQSAAPLNAKIAAIASRWVWVTVSISANDFAKCIVASAASGSLPRYRLTMPGGESLVVFQTNTSEVV